ncbi:class I SAM-dependent methyltransferase [Bacillus siamensis]|uniref:class I SAM-dependent methyltransferase n=1 Tax=Bacillus siamensis TaxID=659243 RepID=UPI000648660C|nr:rRNA adenine N-6-methyltransferase family protein [Bacillus siamensis]
MKRLLFLFQYIVKPRTVGAILPSSRFLAEKMTEKIDFHKAEYIVEYGPGTGVFTKKLLEKRQPGTMILLIEQNEEFYALLKEKYKDEQNLFLVNGSAEHIGKHLKEYRIPHADYVVSGLPFASLPKRVSDEILTDTAKILKNEGEFITFQYTQFKKTLIEQFFTQIEVRREFRNIPPAYVFSCSLPK